MSDEVANVEKQIEIAPPAAQEVKLDLGCGQSPREGFDGVDIVAGPGVKHVLNLWKFPWPWMDNTVSEIWCSHHIEHIPMVWWGKNPACVPEYSHKTVPDSADDKELFFMFFDECHRILKPEGKLTVICPSATSDRGFQDPTHRRWIVANTWLYLSEDWRKANKLDHYNIKCAFSADCRGVYTQAPDVMGRTDEVKRLMGARYRNVLDDWFVIFTAKK